ncbi:MAG: CapA family protein [Spirochaetes bacterium]|nr:CapA family protein [Spirochaetota bacterium]
MNRLVIVLILSLVAVPGCCLKAREARMSFAGDIIMHIPVKISAESRIRAGEDLSSNNGGFDFLYERIRGCLKSSDIVVGNMEFPVKPPFTSRPKIFNARPDALAALEKAGFGIMHLANNHILDQGDSGVASTMEFVRRSGMEYIGVGANEAAARAGIVKKIGGIRVGFIGYTGTLNYPRPARMKGYHLNWLYDAEKLRQDIIDIKKRCDYLVMVAHAGEEYSPVPNPRDVALFKKCIRDGVDLVIGHHPHLIQPVERVVADDGRVCHIFYSLGNFISNQSAAPEAYIRGVPLTTRDAAVVTCVLENKGRRKRPAGRFEILPIYTYNAIEKQTGVRTIQTVPVNQEIQELKKRLSDADIKEKVDIERHLRTLYQKIKVIRLALLGEGEIKEITYIDSGVYE